jgi:hypothetical protein
MKAKVIVLMVIAAVLLSGCLGNDGDEAAPPVDGDGDTDIDGDTTDGEPPQPPAVTAPSCTSGESFRFKSARMEEGKLVAVFESTGTSPLKNGTCKLANDPQRVYPCNLDDRQAYYGQDIEASIENAPKTAEILLTFMRISGAFLSESVTCTRQQ